jgi:hypothetical protein
MERRAPNSRQNDIPPGEFELEKDKCPRTILLQICAQSFGTAWPPATIRHAGESAEGGEAMAK